MEGRGEHLETFLSRWNKQEKGIEAILVWLKEIRIYLSQDIHESYDQLLAAHRQCEVNFSTKNSKIKPSSTFRLRISLKRICLKANLSVKLINIFQDFEKQFEDWTPKKEELQNQEAQLTASINPEDLSILNQRLRLLNKQWDEIRYQVALRKGRIQDLLGQWGTFDGRHKDMLTWIDGMEKKASSDKDFNIEDLLQKLQTVNDTQCLEDMHQGTN